MADKKTEFQKIREIREKDTAQRMEQKLNDSVVSKTQVDNKETSYNYSTGQFE